MSPLGQSGGRSRKHRTGAGAVARATSRERDGVDAPGRSEWEDASGRTVEEGFQRAVVIETLMVLAATFWIILCVVVGVKMAEVL